MHYPRTQQKIDRVLLRIATDEDVDVTAAYRSAGFIATLSTYILHRDPKGPCTAPQERADTNIDLGPEQVVIAGSYCAHDLPGTRHSIPTTCEVEYSSIGTGRATSPIGETSPNAADPDVRVRVAPNTVFALAGLIYVETEAARTAEMWLKRLVLDAEVHTFYDSHQFPLGPHYLNWLSPREYRHYYGEEWLATSRRSGGLAAIHLLAEHLDRCAAMIASAGRAVRIVEHEHNGLRTLWVPPAGEEGLAFHITEQRAEEWAQARTALTGERFTLSRD